mmetsp:Transcript_40521/g.130278  ORF Transcript_40521/g.130278 Transcript_40521/m.130278 type:complete len:194 (-) Transcript_40521:194-775(-)
MFLLVPGSPDHAACPPEPSSRERPRQGKVAWDTELGGEPSLPSESCSRGGRRQVSIPGLVKGAIEKMVDRVTPAKSRLKKLIERTGPTHSRRRARDQYAPSEPEDTFQSDLGEIEESELERDVGEGFPEADLESFASPKKHHPSVCDVGGPPNELPPQRSTESIVRSSYDDDDDGWLATLDDMTSTPGNSCCS